LLFDITLPLISSFVGLYGGIKKGVCTLWWPYMDVTMVVFHAFIRYKKINKIKFIEIKFKRTNLSKGIIINLLRFFLKNQNCGYPISNGLLNFAHTFCHTCKTHWYGLLSYDV
jgi:hypothetical protein